MSSLQHWKALTYFQIGFYVLIAIVDLLQIIQVFKARSNVEGSFEKGVTRIFRSYLIYSTLFVICKITGGVLGAVLLNLKTANTNVLIATYVFDSVSLGFLIKTFLPIVEFVLDKRTDILNGVAGIDSDAKYQGEIERPKKGRYHPFRILTLVLLAAVICTIVASSSMSDNISTYRACLKASALLFLAVVIIMMAMVAYLIKFFKTANYPHSDIVIRLATIVLAATPFLIVRCVYSILSAFSNTNLFEGVPSKYTLFAGDYVYYTFIAFVEECVVIILIILTVWYFLNKVEYLRN